MDETRTSRHQLIQKIEAELNSRVICFILSPEGASIAEDVVPPLFHQLMIVGKVPRLAVILSARGGAPEASLRLLALLREFCDHLSIIPGYRLLSSASFLALGADEIIMTPLSELGPVHIQTGNPLAPMGNDSNPVWVNPYDILAYIDLVKSQGGDAEIIFGEIGVHPLAIGAAFRAYNLAKNIAQKSLMYSKRTYSKTDCEKVIEAFVGNVPSSSVAFSRLECLHDLKLPVAYASPSLEQNLGILLNLYNSITSFCSEYEIDQVTKRETRQITPAILESTKVTALHRRKLERIAQPDGAIIEAPGWGGWIDETIQEAM